MLKLIFSLEKIALKVYFHILFSCFTMFFFTGCSQVNEDTKVKNGVIQISNVDFTQTSKINIYGDGLFYWKQWPIDKNGNFSLDNLKDAATISYPQGIWTSLNYESKGYGTYRFFVKRENLEDELIFNIPRVLGGVEVWINGEKVATHGKISKEQGKEQIDGRPLRIELPQEKLLDIMFLISNSKHRLGGGIAMLNSIQEKTYFQRNYSSNVLIEGIVTFLILIFGVFQIVNYFNFPRYKFFLFFGMFCLFGASRQLFIGEALIYNFIPEIPFVIVQKMRYIGYYGGLASVFLYQISLFPGYLNSKLTKACILLAILGVLYVIIVPVYYTTLSAPIFQVFGLFIILVGFYQMVFAVRDKKPYAKEIAIGLFLICILLANDLLNAMMVIQTRFLVNYGLLAFVFFQTVINGKIQIRREHELLEMSKSVENLSSKISKDQQEIKELRSESYKHIKSKENLVDNLKKVISKDESITIQNIIADLRSELVENASLVKIKNEMEELNYEFFFKLRKQHPNLTKTDLEICSLIRIGLKRKEIANVRNTSLEAVKSSRFRLKKKLKLDVNQNLDTYIREL